MKQLTDTERLEVAMSLLDERQVDEYADRCNELEHGCERNGFHNIPAECEDFECRNCTMTNRGRRAIDCPYVDEDNENQCIQCGKQIPDQGLCGDCAAI